MAKVSELGCGSVGRVGIAKGLLKIWKYFVRVVEMVLPDSLLGLVVLAFLQVRRNIVNLRLLRSEQIVISLQLQKDFLFELLKLLLLTIVHKWLSKLYIPLTGRNKGGRGEESPLPRHRGLHRPSYTCRWAKIP